MCLGEGGGGVFQSILVFFTFQKGSFEYMKILPIFCNFKDVPINLFSLIRMDPTPYLNIISL